MTDQNEGGFLEGKHEIIKSFLEDHIGSKQVTKKYFLRPSIDRYTGIGYMELFKKTFNFWKLRKEVKLIAVMLTIEILYDQRSIGKTLHGITNLDFLSLEQKRSLSSAVTESGRKSRVIFIGKDVTRILIKK